MHGSRAPQGSLPGPAVLFKDLDKTSEKPRGFTLIEGIKNYHRQEEQQAVPRKIERCGVSVGQLTQEKKSSLPVECGWEMERRPRYAPPFCRQIRAPLQSRLIS